MTSASKAFFSKCCIWGSYLFNLNPWRVIFTSILSNNVG